MHLLLCGITFLAGTHFTQRLPLVHSVIMSVAPEYPDRVVPDLLDIFNLKMPGCVHKKKRPVKRIHIAVSSAAVHAGTILPKSEQCIYRLMSVIPVQFQFALAVGNINICRT